MPPRRYSSPCRSSAAATSHSTTTYLRAHHRTQRIGPPPRLPGSTSAPSSPATLTTPTCRPCERSMLASLLMASLASPLAAISRSARFPEDRAAHVS